MLPSPEAVKAAIRGGPVVVWEDEGSEPVPWRGTAPPLRFPYPRPSTACGARLLQATARRQAAARAAWARERKAPAFVLGLIHPQQATLPVAAGAIVAPSATERVEATA